MLASATRTPRDRIIIIDPMPGEKTDHADLAVMALGPDGVMVPGVRDDILDVIAVPGHEIELGWRTREYLDGLAATLESRGLTVRRLPMLAPVFLIEDAREPTGYNAVFYSPTNALQVHLADASHVWLPTFDPAGFPAEYIALAEGYVAEWRGFFEARDMTVLTSSASPLGRALRPLSLRRLRARVPGSQVRVRCIYRLCDAVCAHPPGRPPPSGTTWAGLASPTIGALEDVKPAVTRSFRSSHASRADSTPPR